MYKCEYCKIEIEGSGKQFGAHITNCRSNPKWAATHQKQIEGLRVPRFSFEERCKCGTIFSVCVTQADHNNEKYRKTCSMQCAKSNNYRSGLIRNCVCCNVNLSHYGKFCDSNCQANWNYSEYIKKWKLGEVSGAKGERSSSEAVSSYVRRYLFEKHNSRCSECGWCKVNKFTEKIPLQVHHVDGNSRNHKEDNLELLCPSCHSLTETFGGRNKGKGRKYRYCGRSSMVESNIAYIGM